MTTNTADLGTGGQAPHLPGATPSNNPANALRRAVTDATRRPMSMPQLSLAVPEIPGYYLYWHLSTQVEQALAAGYEFVESEEVSLSNRGVANDQELDGNDDLGSRVSRIAGAGEGVNAPRLYLMKLRNEWREKDVAAMGARNEAVAASIRGGQVGGDGAPAETAADKGRKYLKTGQDLFYPKIRKG